MTPKENTLKSILPLVPETVSTDDATSDSEILLPTNEPTMDLGLEIGDGKLSWSEAT